MKLKGSSCELLILLCVICSINAAVINLNQGDACANVCSGKENIFKYEENKIYTYNFLSRHSVKNPNAKEETLQLELQGKAQVSKITACDFGLLLSDVKLKESLKENSGMSKEYMMMKTMLEKYPLRFGFDDGRVTGVCQDNMDTEFAVNVKRGILSSLQVSVDSLETPNYLTETDIAGECITEYIPKAEPPNFVVITKKKSIAGCSRKSKYFTTLTGRVYDKPKESRNLALLDGEYKCEIKVKVSEGFKESICEESHIFKPFRSETEGSRIVINQELRFDSVKDGKITAKVPTTRSDLTMNHGERKPLHMTMKLAKPQPIVQEICVAVKDKTKSTEIPELFLRLIRSLGETLYDEIKTIYTFIQDDSSCKGGQGRASKIFIDALTNVKTDSAFKFLIEDSKIYKLSKLGLSIFDNPTSAMISILAKKLNEETSYNSVTTIVSSMIKSFCESEPGCMLNPDIVMAMNSITKTLGKDCAYADEKSRTKVLYSLRAIGNAGSHPDIKSSLTIIQACVVKTSNDDDVRVMSIQAVRQFPCNEEVDKFLWRVFEDVTTSPELRIEAYLSLVRCPTRSLFGEVIKKLNKEKSQQLGSFVWSHISNLMETADRFKTDQRDMLQIFTDSMNALSKKFNLDFRSYSKNIEKTYQQGYSAAKVDSNVIFATSSPIPASISFNTTIDIFGRSINLFEIGIRGKGIHDKIFGDTIKPEPHEKPLDEVVKMDQKIKRAADKLSVAVYTKFMGREIYFNPNIITDLLNLMMKKSKTSSFERSLLLLDSTVSVGSISGFPIELQIESTASVDVNMMKNDPLSYSDMELSTKVNYGIQVSGKLLVNAHCTKIGIQSKGLLSRDMEIGGKLKLKNSPSGDLDDYQFEINKMPDNSKLFSISNELSLVTKLEKVKMIQAYETKLEKCTGEGLQKIMGVKVCVMLKEAPKFSSYLSNIKADITIEKFSGLKIQWKKESTLKPVKKLKSLLISASFPGAEEDTFRLQVERDSKKKRQMYEILLWKKMIYLKYEINDNKISGELKSGKTEAKLSGVYESKGMLTSEMNVDIKSDKNTGKLYFSQKFTKAGPEIILKLSRDGDKAFNLVSKTTVQQTGHKVFSKFERFRHSTVLKYSGDNEMSFIVESSKGNKPPTEVKSKIEIYWKTKAARNFYVRQNYIWEKLIQEETSVVFGKVSGTKWNLNLDHEIEVKTKKFNVSNNLEYFLSSGFFQNKPFWAYLNFKREDLLNKEIVLETKSQLGMDLSNLNEGKFLLESGINYKKDVLARKLKSSLIWKLNKIQMYDINAELVYEKFLEMYFKHQFTTTQKGTTSIEMKIVDKNYLISSELNLPKNHLLTIKWPNNVVNVYSDVDAKSLGPLDVVVNHGLKLNDALLAKITNSAKYNSEKKEITITSVAKDSKDVTMFNINLERKLNYDFSKSRVFYEYNSLTSITIPKYNVDNRISIEQLLDIDWAEGLMTKKKTFTTKVVAEVLNKATKPKYGFEILVTKKQDTIPYRKIKSIFYTGNAANSVTMKWGKDYQSFLFGATVDVKNELTAEMSWKLIRKGSTANISMLSSLNSKTNPDFNFYLKRNSLINWEVKNSLSLKYSGEYGKGKTDPKLVSYNGLITAQYSGWKMVDLTWTMNCPNTCMNLATVNFVLNYKLDNNEPQRFLGTFKNIIKWQKTGSRTANYYDLQANLNADTKFKKMELDISLAKDTNVNKLFSMNAAGTYGKLASFSVKVGEKFAKVLVNMDFNDNDKKMKLDLSTSNILLKKLIVLVERKPNENIISTVCTFEFTSNDKDYQLTINRLEKRVFNNRIDLVENIKWESNIPYIKSGATTLGLLVQKSNFQCSFSQLYDKVKIIDLKIDTSNVAENLKVALETNIRKPCKFVTSYSKTNGVIKYDFDFTYGQGFFRILDMTIDRKTIGSVYSTSFKVTVKTSKDYLKELDISREMSIDFNNILATFKTDVRVKLNGEELITYSIDMPQGKIYEKNRALKYIKIFDIKSYEFDCKFKILTVRDFVINYKLIVDDKAYSEMKLEYFRMKDTEKSKKIDSLGEALFYFIIDIKRQSSSGKMEIFVDKTKTSAVVKMVADMPVLKMKFDEVMMKFSASKDALGSYSGSVKYKNSNYRFNYKIFDGYKRELQMTAESPGAEPKEITMAFDFTKNYMFKINFDKYFIVDLNLLQTVPKEHSGKIMFSYKGEDKINLKTQSKVVIPANVKSFSDFLMAVFGLKVGLDFQIKVDGSVLMKTVKSDMRLYHLHSDVFSTGTKSYNLVNFEITDGGKKSYSMLVSFDRKFPNIKYEDMFEMKLDDVVKFKTSNKITRESDEIMELESNVMFEKYKSSSSLKNNKKMIHGFLSYGDNGYGFQVVKKTYEASIFRLTEVANFTYTTNLGYFVKFAIGSTEKEIWPIGKAYFVSAKDTKTNSKFDIRIERTKSMAAKISISSDLVLQGDVTVTINLYKDILTIKSKENNVLGLEMKYENSKGVSRSMTFKSKIVYALPLTQVTLSSKLTYNKKNVLDLTIESNSDKGKSPYTLDMNYKGSFLITGNAKLDTKNKKFSHFMTVKDEKYKTELWSCNSKCSLKSEFDCFFVHSNKAREIRMAMIWKKNVNLLEFTWNKRKEQGFIVSCERMGQKTFVTLSSPIRTIQLTRLATVEKGTMKRQLTLGIVRKADPSKPLNLTLDIAMKGTIKSDYDFDARIETNLLHKPLKLSIKRQLKKSIGDIYYLNIKSSFEGEMKPFFTLESNIRQITASSYEMKLHATNDEKFLNLSAAMTFTYQEISFEYKIIQNDNKQRDFIFKMIPLKSFLLTNKKDFKILCSRTDYQYGYRRDIVMKLGKKGPQISAYSTMIRSPMKYYAEVSNNGDKLVVDFRPVGNLFIGDVYRKKSGTKIQDLKLTMSIDSKSIMTTNIYWNPKFIDAMKACVKDVLKPENLKAIMVDAYQNSENRISTFSSNIKMKLAKNINAAFSLEFVKGVANDIESIPTAVTVTYDDDDLYMKTIMDNWREFLKRRDISKTFERTKNSVKMTSESMASTLYGWFVEARWYGVLYNPIQSKLDSLSYENVKSIINAVVYCGKKLSSVVRSQISTIGTKLELLSKRVESASKLASTLSDSLVSNFKGSTVGQMLQLLGDVKETMIEGLGQIVETEFIKQRLAYYNTTIKNIKELTSMTKEMTKKMLKYVKSSNVVTNVMETIKLIKSMKYKEAFLNMIKPDEAKFEMDLDKGSLDMRLYVPPLVRPVYKMMKTSSDWFPAQMLSQMRGAGLGGKLLSLFYRYEYLVFNYGTLKSLKNLLPPFKKSAWVLNGNSILTYDGSAIRIGSGTCSYVLARDTTYNSFNLIMNIKSDGQSKEFELSYIKKISILSSGKVQVDGKSLDTLPQIIKSDKGKKRSVEIYNDYDVTKIVTSEGLIVEYYNNLDDLKVTLNGKWHGKVKGLLGSNDFDLVNDWTTSSGESTQDAGVLSNSWSIGTCNSGTKTKLYAKKVNPNFLKQCTDLFTLDSMSYLSRCFSLINPEPYYELCQKSLQYLKMETKEFEKMICNLSRNYVVRCKSKGMLLRLKQSCVTCGTEKLTRVTTKSLLKKDVKFNYIFIIEQSKCLLPYKNVLKNLEKVMSLEKDNMYTLLTFNGIDMFKNVHFKSVNGQVNVKSKDFGTLLKELKESAYWSTLNTSDTSTQGSQAIFDAIKMPSKPGYIEKIIFIGCSSCGENKKFLFSTLAGLLKYSGITMTYLTAQPFTGSSYNDDVAGFGNNLIYYFDKDTLKTKTWVKDIQAPDDVCSYLSQIHGGIDWSLKAMNTEMRQRRISETLHTELKKVSNNLIQKCFCGTGNYEEGRVECKMVGLV